MHLHCRFYLQTGSDIQFQCRFYLKTDSDINFHCWSFLKTGSDVHAPYIKQTADHIHRSHPPTNSHSLISHVSLSLLKKSTLSTWFGHGSCIFQRYWYVVFSNILSIFIWSIFIFMFVYILHLYIFLFLAFDLYLIMLPHFT